ncbi:hypothetical protein KFE94_06660 [bacterium SCSIO 12643]|nr:hypothetical protein KFE94_06660 [bacterium SCSIO 12643]
MNSIYTYISIILLLLINFTGLGQFQERLKSDVRLSQIDLQLKSNIDSAYYLAEDLLLQQDIDEEETKWAYSVLALVEQLKGNGYDAVIHLEESKNYEVDDPYLNAYSLYVDALISIEIANESQALETILEAIDIFENLNSDENLAGCYTILSKIYSNLDKPTLASENLQKALSIHTKNNNFNRIAGDYHNLAILALGTHPDSSLTLLNKAIQINLQNDNIRWLANNYYMKSNVFVALQKMDSAFHYIRKAESLYIELKDKSSELGTKSTLGHLYFKANSLDSAKSAYKTVIWESKNQPNQIDISDVYKNMADIYFLEAQFDSSRSYTQLFMNAKDSINKKKNQHILSIVTLRNEFELQKEELLLENDRIKLSVQRKNTLITALIILIVMISFFIYNIYRWKKLDKKKNEVDAQLMQKEIELKNKELTLAVMGQLKQTKSLDKLEEQLAVIEDKAPKKLKPELQKLISEVSRDNGPLLWKEFELRFSNVHNEFYERLKERAPDLTPAEIKVCSFLKLGLNSKEISALLFKTPASIEVDRARIRKKLGLTNSKTNLSQYIFDI